MNLSAAAVLYCICLFCGLWLIESAYCLLGAVWGADGLTGRGVFPQVMIAHCSGLLCGDSAGCLSGKRGSVGGDRGTEGCAILGKKEQKQ